MILKLIAPGFLLAAASFNAYAGEGGTVRDLTLDDLRAKCKELSSDPQIKPFKARVSCDQTRRYWQAAKPTQGSLQNSMNGGFSIQMKGFSVQRQAFDVAQDATQVDCKRHTEYEQKVQAIAVELTCQELLDIEDMNSYCTRLVAQRLQDDPDLGEVQATGNVDYHCPGEQASR